MGAKKTATQLSRILTTGGSDSSLGLSFVRRFEPGKVGFAGTLVRSDGSSLPVRVLSGLPDVLWSEDTKFANRVARVDASNPAFAAAVTSSAKEPVRVRYRKLPKVRRCKVPTAQR